MQYMLIHAANPIHKQTNKQNKDSNSLQHDFANQWGSDGFHFIIEICHIVKSILNLFTFVSTFSKIFFEAEAITSLVIERLRYLVLILISSQFKAAAAPSYKLIPGSKWATRTLYQIFHI